MECVPGLGKEKGAMRSSGADWMRTVRQMQRCLDPLPWTGASMSLVDGQESRTVSLWYSFSPFLFGACLVQNTKKELVSSRGKRSSRMFVVWVNVRCCQPSPVPTCQSVSWSRVSHPYVCACVLRTDEEDQVVVVIPMLSSRDWCAIVLCLSSIPATALIQIPSSRQRAISSEVLLRRHKLAENRNPEFDSGESNVILVNPPLLRFSRPGRHDIIVRTSGNIIIC
ncbi:hypothetical protein BDP55DRAFT_161416 [Colletotrichum godetiae]|uniref:Uncharacterized protein n=1 Tax=Colletotrichum godetiae TaxID=1209918 RepID=A0AAJ0AMR4_9PEZI|nr:uncharacterized protein BDP55DRAFT_161416 [Colletotrichum godetiae]KAK1675268.1 hypothetical protein BDP55DRAFT_161416 [Colletotrichum godetiae]